MLAVVGIGGMAYTAFSNFFQPWYADLPSEVDISKTPWLAKREWREKKIISEGMSLHTIVLLALMCNLLLSIFLFYFDLVFLSDNSTLWGSLFALLLFVILGGLVYVFQRHRKFGASVCYLKTLPIKIGEALNVEVEAFFPKKPCGLLKAVLCNRTRIAASNSQYVVTHWKAEVTISEKAIQYMGKGKVIIPVCIDIPDADENQYRDMHKGEQSYWELRLTVPFSGVNYSSQFLVPVFKFE